MAASPVAQRSAGTLAVHHRTTGTAEENNAVPVVLAEHGDLTEPHPTY